MKFTDAELLGMPLIVTISPRSLAAGGAEVTVRATGERTIEPLEARRSAPPGQGRVGGGRPTPMGALLEYGAFLALARGCAARAGGMAPAARRPAADCRAAWARTPRSQARLAAAEERAAAAERDAAVLVELLGVGAVRVAPDLTVTTANEAAHRLVGRRPGAMVGRSVLEAFTDHHVEEIARPRSRPARRSASSPCGSSRGRPSWCARGGRRGGDAWLVLEDVSELRRLQRIRTEFIDNLSHELRTPLTTVSLLAEMLAADADALPPKAAERVAKIEVETGHLVQMVNELLDLSRIESGIATVALDDIDLGSLAIATADRIQPLRRAPRGDGGGRWFRPPCRPSAATGSGWARRS